MDKKMFMRSTMIPIVTFLAPSFWMNLPSRVIHQPTYGLLGSYGFTLRTNLHHGP